MGMSERQLEELKNPLTHETSRHALQENDYLTCIYKGTGHQPLHQVKSKVR